MGSTGFGKKKKEEEEREDMGREEGRVRRNERQTDGYGAARVWERQGAGETKVVPSGTFTRRARRTLTHWRGGER